MSATRKFKEAIYSVEIRRRFEKDLWLVGRRTTAGIENDPRIGQLDVARIVWLDHFSAKNSDIEVFRFFLISHGEEMRGEEPSCAIGASGRFMRCSPIVDKLGCGRNCLGQKEASR